MDRTTQTMPETRAALLPMAGLGTGTMVMTMRGEVAVEDLRAGDRVVTRHAGALTLRGVEARTSRVAPVRVRAGSLGHTRPERDMERARRKVTRASTPAS